MDYKHILLNRNSPGEDTDFERRVSIHVDGLAFLYKGYWFERQKKAWNEGGEGKRLEVGEHVRRERQGNMYVKRGMEEIVCLKKEMGLREEEREFDESVLPCLH